MGLTLLYDITRHSIHHPNNWPKARAILWTTERASYEVFLKYCMHYNVTAIHYSSCPAAMFPWQRIPFLTTSVSFDDLAIKLMYATAMISDTHFPAHTNYLDIITWNEQIYGWDQVLVDNSLRSESYIDKINICDCSLSVPRWRISLK